MAIGSLDQELNVGVVDELRDRARRGASVPELVEFLRESLRDSEVFVVPMLAYFCRAFSISLRDALPLREWVGTQDDDTIQKVIDRIEAFRRG